MLTLLHQVIEHYVPEFTEHLRDHGHFLPKFVFQEFNDYLKCGRRMVDTAAHLVDQVLPQVPVRQRVLAFPYPLRLLYSTHPHAMTRTLKIVLRAIETHLIKKAGLTRASGARSRAVTFIQRFASALNLNVHLHILIPDGVYALRHDNPRFCALPAAGYSPCETPYRGHLQVPSPSQSLALAPRPRVNLTRYHGVSTRQLKAA